MPASQCGIRSAAKWEAMASGIPSRGFATLTAIEAPISACAVAVIYVEFCRLSCARGQKKGHLPLVLVSYNICAKMVKLGACVRHFLKQYANFTIFAKLR